MEKDRIKWIANGLLAIVVAGILAVVFVEDPFLSVGELSGQWNWIAKSGMLFGAVGSVVSLFAWRRLKENVLSGIVIWILILYGGIEAIYGLKQIYGYASSNHSLYAMTGSFFNPGPYSGYLAMVFPLCLNEWLEGKKKKDTSYCEKAGYCVAIGVMLLILCVLPAGMSRSAWMAAAVSGVWVYSMHAGWRAKLAKLWHEQRKCATMGIALILFSGILIFTLLFHLKKDSADGRLFMWKISCLAIAEQPLSGHGWGSFVRAYGDAQEGYFAGGAYREQEEIVAGSPEFAFNEYLQIAVEWGIPACMAVLALIGFCLYRGVALWRIGACGGVISLLVFSFSSYPMQLPALVVSFLFLLIACVIRSLGIGMLLFSLCIGWGGVELWKRDTYKECREWTNNKIYYHAGAYAVAEEGYAKLYPALKDRGAFLFEYGHCLHKQEKYESSNQILSEAARYSCDPMILNVIGKNYQEIKEYAKAEHYLIRSTHRLPGRIYPYYLLTKLYAEWGQPERMREMAAIVLTKEPKVQSTAIKEMREEIEKMVH